jgi:hypothetical protein
MIATENVNRKVRGCGVACKRPDGTTMGVDGGLPTVTQAGAAMQTNLVRLRRNIPLDDLRIKAWGVIGGEVQGKRGHHVCGETGRDGEESSVAKQ